MQIFFVVTAFVIALIVFPASVQAQTVATPTLFCLGGCPTPTSTPAPTDELTTTASPTESDTTATPTTIEDPCQTTESTVSAARHHKHKHGRGGMFQFLLQLLMKLFELLGLGNGNIPLPTPTPTPTGTTPTEPVAEPTEPTNPCPTATTQPTVEVPTATTAVTPKVTTVPTTSTTSTGMKLISRSVPAFASSGTASAGNDADYNTNWQGNSATSWLAYDLSKVPADQRQKNLLVWYNDSVESYDPALASESLTNNPQNYTIETNTAAGGTVPTSGWTTKATISSNKYHSRQHAIDMTGANWIRLSTTAISGGSKTNLNMDVYDVHTGIDDDWIIYGSSTPAMSMGHGKTGNNSLSFSQQINKSKPDHFPVQENGSISGLDSADGVKNMSAWLSVFPGKYVGIALGANDADECMDPETFYNNFEQMVETVEAAGKIAVVPLFNWSKLETVQSCGPGLIAKLQELYTAHPSVVKGPDLWTYFKAHPELVSSDNQHPTDEGTGVYRQMWADTALQTVYK